MYFCNVLFGCARRHRASSQSRPATTDLIMLKGVADHGLPPHQIWFVCFHIKVGGGTPNRLMTVKVVALVLFCLWCDNVHTGYKNIRSEDSGELARNQNINISDLLDQLLLGYDYHIRPDFGGPPIEVFIDFHVRSMGPISEIDMTYVMDCYFRQTWIDKRLSYTSRSLMEINANQSTNQTALALSIYMLDKIWKPPTYFLNSRQSHMHVITLPNKFVRIYSDGKVLYSSRMTITANCPMNLENFPMDTQRCPLALGSFGYSMQDVIYSWNPARKVVINPDMKMSQFDLIAVPVSNTTNSQRRDGPYSILLASFHFKRHMGSFLIEVYAPCIMLVVLSWVSFWINREATGLTTVLTMTFLGLELRNDLPKVPYLTALDCFVYISFAFISATILEFGFVHYFTKIGSGEYYFSPAAFMQLDDNTGEDSDSSSDEEDNYDRAHTVCKVMTSGLRSDSKRSRKQLSDENNDKDIDIIRKMKERTRDQPYIFHRQQSEIYSTTRDHGLIVLKRGNSEPLSTIESDEVSNQPSTSSYRSGREFERPVQRKKDEERNRSRFSSLRASIRKTFSRKKSRRQSISFKLNSVSKIDKISRFIFPLLFIIMNFVYWYTYLRAEMIYDAQNLLSE